jgi:hypothetical protein
MGIIVNMKICPNGHEVNDDVKYCPTCGAEIISGNKFCTKCGSVRKGMEKNCSHCGTPFDSSNERMIFTEGKGNHFKKYLPYILGAIVVLAIIGYFSSNNGSSSQSQTEIVDSLAVGNETSATDNNTLIADYDERKVYSGEYVFDAVLTVSATLEKSESTFTIKVDGDKVSIPTNDGKAMTGFIYNDDLGIDVFYDYGDDLHYLSMNLKPNDREGKEWVGGFQPTGIYYDVVLKLKECKHKGNAVKITKEREADNDNETAESEKESSENNPSYSSSNTSSSRTFANEQYVTMYLANQTFRSSDGFTIRFDGDLRMYAEGDFAGVVSVLRYNSTSALLRYGGGQYTEGRFSVQIVGDKLQLTDPVDGTVYYQR